MYVVRPDFPDSGVYVGAEVPAFVNRFLEQWSSITYEIESVREAGDTLVLRVRQRSTGVASGVEGDQMMFMLISFRGGKIIRMETVMHESDALAAAGIAD